MASQKKQQRAVFASKCHACGQPIQVGERITRNAQNQWIHVVHPTDDKATDSTTESNS